MPESPRFVQLGGYLETYLDGTGLSPQLPALLASLPDHPEPALAVIHLTLERCQRGLTHDHTLLAFDATAHLLGALCLDANPNATRRHLWLLGALGHQGVGRALIERATEVIPPQCHLVCTPVRGTEEFWRKCGFAQTQIGAWELPPRELGFIHKL